MGVYDQAARFATKAEPGFVLARLRPETGLTLTFRRWFATKEVPLPGGADRDADLVAVADEQGGPAWLLIFEVQSSHDRDKPKVLQLEAMTFLVYAKDADRGGGELAPLPVFVYLTGRCPDRGVVARRTPSGRGFLGEPALWEVGEDSAAETLAKVASGEYSWGALFWAPLMRGADDREVIDLWVKLRNEKVPEAMRPSLTVVALTFADLAGIRPAWNRVKGEVEMTESPFINELMEEMTLRNFREALVEAIKGRFPELLTPDVERAIAAQPSLSLMRSWHSAAVRAKTADEFLAVLRR